MSQTDWSLIGRAALDSGVEGQATALEIVARRYWPAIYAYIRATGRSVDEAADLTQGFICDVVLARGLLLSADPERGRFRSLLLRSVENYLRETHRHRTRKKRSSEGQLPVQLPTRELAGIEAKLVRTPQEAFLDQWNATLVRRVLDHVRTDCVADGLATHWTIFEARVVRPQFFGDRPIEYSELVERFRLSDLSQASNMMITVKRRFARALREEVKQTLEAETTVDEELREMIGAMEQSHD